MDLEQYIQNLPFPEEPAGLYEPIRYTMKLGGKRLRPKLCLMACELFSGDSKAAEQAAMGIEVFHNFTLLHDDIMDKAELRRGKPVVHKVWSENTAILSGDAMLIEAYKLVSQVPAEKLPAVIKVFSDVALGVCEGQQYDMEFETRDDVVMQEYINMITLKTGVLLAGALKIGAILGGASEEDANHLYDFGINIGIGFQLRDDYLDTFGDTAVFGKAIGGDILCGKKTYLLLRALENSNEGNRLRLKRYMGTTGINPDDKIHAVKAVYEKTHADTDCIDAINAYCTKAIECINLIKGNIAPTLGLINLAKQLSSRSY